MEDYYSINVAVRIAPESKPFGPYHEHMMKITIPAGRTKREAVEIYNDVCSRYPEPVYKVTLSENVYRTSVVRESSGGIKKVRA
jgi:hypothetical protein